MQKCQYSYSPAQDTGFYYLQSRYYDPAIGRFINADVYTSTGKGILGFNMFAYCNNNSVNSQDPSGQDLMKRSGIDEFNPLAQPWEYSGGGGGGGASLATTALSLAATAAGLIVGQSIYILHTKSDRETHQFQQSLKQETSFTKPQSPHIHHIVPVGSFSKRSAETQAQIKEMHSILKRNGINRYVDPMNLMLVSAKTHASLHTDAYIAHVYSYITQAGDSKERIYVALFYLRIEIAAMDAFAFGY